MEKTLIDISDLAIFSGKPAFEEKLFVGRPNIGNRQLFMEMVNDILDRRWLTNDGKYVKQFEQRVADILGAKHCITMCNGTIALEIATRALGFTGEVLVPSFTFIATAHSLQWQQITPVFCDIDPITHCIDPECVERMITPRTKGIVGVHVWARPCNIEALVEIAERRGLKIIFDASHAFGCSYKGKMVGNFGNAEVFSFHATKFLNTFEGGAVVTSDDDLAARIRLMKNFGFAGYDKVIYIGTNGKMTEVSAAMGLASLESMSEFIAVNRNNYMLYRESLSEIPGLRILTFDDLEKTNYQYVVLEIDETLSGISRDSLIRILHAENVVARRYFYPGCHRMEPYFSFFPHAKMLLPNTEQIVRKVLTLPTGTTVSRETVRKICELIRFSIVNGQEITRKLSLS
jgi:dTDP-4-amino-4,6-dideoxygalactose transaminase